MHLQSFWKWWPELSKNLLVLRVTGGEPLLSKDTDTLIEKLLLEPKPHLELILNSNLSLDFKIIKKLSQNIKKLNFKKSVKKISIITSMEAIGPAAEYIRYGIDNHLFWLNLKFLLDENPALEISITSTIQALSVDSFIDFAKELLSFRTQNNFKFLTFDPSPLQHPDFLSIENLPIVYKEKFKIELVQFIEAFQAQLTSYERIRLLAVIAILKEKDLQKELGLFQSSFYRYFSSYDQVRKTDFRKTFPALAEYFSEI